MILESILADISSVSLFSVPNPQKWRKRRNFGDFYVSDWRNSEKIWRGSVCVKLIEDTSEAEAEAEAEAGSFCKCRVEFNSATGDSGNNRQFTFVDYRPFAFPIGKSRDLFRSDPIKIGILPCQDSKIDFVVFPKVEINVAEDPNRETEMVSVALNLRFPSSDSARDFSFALEEFRIMVRSGAEISGDPEGTAEKMAEEEEKESEKMTEPETETETETENVPALLAPPSAEIHNLKLSDGTKPDNSETSETSDFEDDGEFGDFVS